MRLDALAGRRGRERARERSGSEAACFDSGLVEVGGGRFKDDIQYSHVSVGLGQVTSGWSWVWYWLQKGGRCRLESPRLRMGLDGGAVRRGR
jgi:hypothetical protein